MSHFHPSVSVNAAHLLQHEPMSGKPDLTLHTLTHFLDRFVYRTPKAAAAARGASIMQPLAGAETADRLVEAGKAAAHQGMPLNSENFWKKAANDVAAEDVFFHEYFNRVNKDKARSKKGKGAGDSVARDEEDEGLSDNEDEIWKALVDSRPDLEADEDSDDDLDMDDLESAYDDEDDLEGAAEGSGDDEVIFNDESDEPSDEEMAEFSGFEDEEETAAPTPITSKKTAKKPGKEKPTDAGDEEDAFDMDVSDDEAFIDSDEDLPSDMEFGGVDLPATESAAPSKSKKRKLKHLPTFASADDYAALLADEDEGM